MNKTLLLTDGEYEIWKYEGVPEAVHEFFKQVNWGSEGAVYERINITELIPQLHQAHLVTVQKGEVIHATAIFCRSEVSIEGEIFTCEYIRYFAASKEIQGRKLVKYYAGKVMENVRNEGSGKTIFIGCVEKGNIRSYKVVENAGYKRIGFLTVNAFSRFFPKIDQRVTHIKTKAEQQQVLALLKDQYRHHSLVHFNYVFLNDNYFVIRDGDEILAGCQFHRVNWVINRMPGLSGKIIINVLPHLPLMNRLFNPKKFEFLAFEGIYFKQGHEPALLKLFESLLAKENLYSALFWMGNTCPYHKSLMKNGQLGMLHSFVKDSGAMVMASYSNLSDQEIKSIESNPMFASGFDYI